jgi:2,4-dienoyl-CoA reductase-like NADH-dependent reductase (Old Yellow Enzyme family)
MIAAMAFARLFEPLDVGPVRLRNRIVSTSHQTSLVHDHVPTDALVAYHEARARGGVGLIVIEATAVHPTGLLTAHTIGGYLPAVVPAYRRVADAVHAGGARLFGQLFHGGRELITAGFRPPAVAPSAVPSQRFGTEPRALTAGEIRELVAGYGQAAAYAREGGLDGVEVCAGFSYLPTQFLSGHTNRRADGYGGSFENRLRFLREVLAAMRDGIGPDGAVGARLSADELSPDGADPADVLEAAIALDREGLVDYISVTLGGSASYVGSTYIVPPPPIAADEIAAAARPIAEAVRVPVIATSRIAEPAVAERLLADGVCDAVGMTRALIADPAMPRKAQAGEAPTLCIGCNQGCIGHYHAGLPITCTVNPWAGSERTLPRPADRAAAGTTVVVGAGPAGCAAAAAAVARGERAIVFERADAPGGQMRLALAAPGHADVARALVANLERWLAGADVRLRVAADADAVVAERPDRVVLATGARPYAPQLAGAGVPVLQAFDVLAGATVGPRVAVADWGHGWIGLDVAEALAARGASVRLVSGAAAVGEGVHQYQRNLYLARLDAAGVELVHHLQPVGVRPGAVELRHVFSGREVVLDGVDTLVVAAGREPDDELAGALERRGVAFERVGDVLGPRSFEEAIREGTVAGMGLPAATAAA